MVSRQRWRQCLVVVVAGLILAVASTTAAGARHVDEGDGPDDPSTTIPSPADPDPDIIPQPNSGRPPQSADDRGGALQFAVLGLIVAALALGVSLVIRESRRKQQS